MLLDREQSTENYLIRARNFVEFCKDLCNKQHINPAYPLSFLFQIVSDWESFYESLDSALGQDRNNDSFKAENYWDFLETSTEHLLENSYHDVIIYLSCRDFEMLNNLRQSIFQKSSSLNGITLIERVIEKQILSADDVKSYGGSKVYILLLKVGFD